LITVFFQRIAVQMKSCWMLAFQAETLYLARRFLRTA
jgi:hypothetical protein